LTSNKLAPEPELAILAAFPAAALAAAAAALALAIIRDR
jgi:hypothetical protein